PGDPCPFNGTHADADYCQAGMACLGYDRDVVNTPCDSDDDCTEVIPPVENPECADDSLCGGSFCAPPCDENGQCDDGFVPDDVSGDCYCIPVMTGDAVAGDPCPFGDINVSADYCVAGLSCIGMEPSDQILCPTDVSECIGDDIYSTWNPECIGGECGMSFCAAPCNETEPYCDTGFEQILVGLEEDCFCAPEEL
ncbi:MAG: hypothetical protein JXR96_21255, partial [Deltaproteobacteria bacterium]|nr:hypothetical protein [Deltaproteobacteria bacterium]